MCHKSGSIATYSKKYGIKKLTGVWFACLMAVLNLVCDITAPVILYSF